MEIRNLYVCVHIHTSFKRILGHRASGSSQEKLPVTEVGLRTRSIQSSTVNDTEEWGMHSQAQEYTLRCHWY